MSKIEIINRALLKLGEPPVSSVNDTAFGKSYEMIYEDMKNLLLSSYPWRFAVDLRRVSRCDEKYGERYKYPLPSDCALLLGVFIEGGINLNYDLADNCIVCSYADGIDMEYVKIIDDDTYFPFVFREALVAKIAAELAMRLKQNAGLKQLYDNEFYNFIRQAELNNEISKSVENLPDNSWIRIRQTW